MAEHPQLDFDSADAAFECALRERWERLEREEAAKWTEEALCICWVTKSDGRHWQDWWQQLRRFEREHFLNCYRLERESADYGQRAMRPYEHMTVPQEVLDREWKVISNMAVEIRKAAAQGRPCPYRACEDATPWERMQFEGTLNLAFMEAGVVIVQAASDETPKKRRK